MSWLFKMSLDAQSIKKLSVTILYQPMLVQFLPNKRQTEGWITLIQKV